MSISINCVSNNSPISHYAAMPLAGSSICMDIQLVCDRGENHNYSNQLITKSSEKNEGGRVPLLSSSKCDGIDTDAHNGCSSRKGLSNAGFSFFFKKIIITNFTNRFMQCRQSTGAGKPIIQHCILFSTKRLTGFLTNLWTSNTCNKMPDAVKIKDVDDFVKECRTGRLDQTNVSFSNTPASMDTACQCTITSMTKNNFNNNNVWNDKQLVKTSGITAYLNMIFSSHMRQLSLHSCQHYFFN